jgi:hypothetical protein
MLSGWRPAEAVDGAVDGVQGFISKEIGFENGLNLETIFRFCFNLLLQFFGFGSDCS